jgi:hypothetical protein
MLVQKYPFQSIIIRISDVFEIQTHLYPEYGLFLTIKAIQFYALKKLKKVFKRDKKTKVFKICKLSINFSFWPDKISF